MYSLSKSLLCSSLHRAATINARLMASKMNFSSSKGSEHDGNCSRFKGKVAIVTASTEGIGFAIAKRLGAEGAKVVVSSRRSKNVDKAVETLTGLGYSVLGLTCHVAKEEDRKNLVEKTLSTFGGIDIFVSNAAVSPAMGGVLQCSEPLWDKIFEINVKNALQFSQLVVPHMKKRNGGSIVYVSSIAGFQPFSALGAYSVSKSTLLGLTKAVAQEVASDNIRVNCVAPGLIRTRFSEPLYSSEEVLEKALEPILLNRIGEPHEIAGLVAFLCSDDASYVTGENYVAAGGMPSRLIYFHDYLSNSLLNASIVTPYTSMIIFQFFAEYKCGHPIYLHVYLSNSLLNTSVVTPYTSMIIFQFFAEYKCGHPCKEKVH